MENYEVKNISQTSEIKKAYEEAVAQNAKFYRAISSSGAIYGWNSEGINPKTGLKGVHVKAVDGQEWFENDKYVEPIVEKTDDEIIDEAVEALDKELDESNAEVQEIVEEAKEEVVNEVATEEPTTEQTVDYKALYETAIAEKDELEAKLIETEKAFADYKAVVEAFKAL